MNAGGVGAGQIMLRGYFFFNTQSSEQAAAGGGSILLPRAAWFEAAAKASTAVFDATWRFPVALF